MQVVIMAGGKGTRISSMISKIPKPMIKINGKPILEYQIDFLKRENFKDIILVTGHLGEQIKIYFGDGSRFGVNITYFHEIEPLGTAGGLYHLKEKLTENFILLNGDIILDVNLSKFIDFHMSRNAKASIIVHPNSHPFDSALIMKGNNDVVLGWLNKEEKRTIYKNCVNAGVHILSKYVIEKYMNGKKCDLDRDVLKKMIETLTLYAYHSTEYIKDMGTPERYKLVSSDLKSSRVSKRNLANKQKAIFIDRDGTINKHKGFINDYNDIELLEGVGKAIKIINDSEYLAIVITNQPVVARGECTVEQLELVNNNIETLLGKEGAYIDDLFYCPHHPDSGFNGEIKELKFNCDCRKPKPGMILEASKKYNIDLSSSYMVGDSIIDIKAGLNAGCKSVYVGKDKIKNEFNCIIKENLLEFIEEYIKGV